MSENFDWKEALKAQLPSWILLGILGIGAFSYRAELRAWFAPPQVGDTRATGAPMHEHAHDGADPDGIAHYTCPMHPSITSPDPGACPSCGMDLIPVLNSELASGEVRVDPLRMDKLGIRTHKVRSRELQQKVIAHGELRATETGLYDITLRSAGWVDKLWVEETGRAVKKGQRLLSLYSPEILTASEELLAARQGGPATRERMVKAARTKLRLLGMSPGQIDRLEERGAATDHITVSAPASGFIVRKEVVEGDRVEAGRRLFQVADLSEIWVEAEVYERDLGALSLGDKVQIELPFDPAAGVLEGAIDYIHPRVDPATRSVKVRVVLPNPETALRPGSYAKLTFARTQKVELAAPRSALIYAGPRHLVFVELGEGRYEPRELKLGRRGGDWVEVLEGLEEGDAVVWAGAFLIAAESRLKDATGLWEEAPQP